MTTLELAPIPEAEDAPQQDAVAPESPVVTIVRQAIEAGEGMDKLTGLYLKLRGGADDLKKQLSAKMAPINKAMDMIENHFLAKMNEMGVENLKNANGTPYKTIAVSVSVADNEAFVSYVLLNSLGDLPLNEETKHKIVEAMKNNGAFALIESRASKSAVEAQLEATGELPPGLNRRVEVKVNVKSK